jgi:D-sedoheptulose 7-phosphate isomerase
MSKLDFHVDSGELRRYFTTLSDALAQTAVTSASGDSLEMARLSICLWRMHAEPTPPPTTRFLGNGGSAAIASHMATDYSKNGNVRALALNDSSMLTCLGNDLGYDQVFAKQIELHARPDDVVVAISSSGSSANILNAVPGARAAKCAVATFSGFKVDNPLRRPGDINFYLKSDRYGFVEIGPLTICQAILDFICGLRNPEGALPPA